MAEMKLKDFLPLLRKGLEDEEIRRMIRQIIAEQSAVNDADVSVQEYKAEIERLQTDCEKNRKAAEKANEERKAKAELADQQAMQLSDLMVQLENQRKKIEDLQVHCEDFKQKIAELNSILKDAQEKRDWYKGEREYFESENNKLNSVVASLEHKLDTAQAEHEKLTAVNKNLTEKLDREVSAKEALQSLLVECFGEGYALYQKYQQISPYSHKLLAGVFHREDFESFIIGGSQPDAPERIWDIMKYRIGDPELPVLWQIFVYFIGLCNKSSKEDIYAIENVQQGDEYDYERHAPDQNSKAQGRITEV